MLRIVLKVLVYLSFAVCCVSTVLTRVLSQRCCQGRSLNFKTFFMWVLISTYQG